jgi:hypothetical protein
VKAQSSIRSRSSCFSRGHRVVTLHTVPKLACAGLPAPRHSCFFPFSCSPSVTPCTRRVFCIPHVHTTAAKVVPSSAVGLD